MDTRQRNREPLINLVYNYLCASTLCARVVLYRIWRQATPDTKPCAPSISDFKCHLIRQPSCSEGIRQNFHKQSVRDLKKYRDI